MSEAPSSLIDAASRGAALDVTRSFIVQAPAGSGKTGLLIQRTLALLATVRQPEEVVAITFTRKAAAEMRERMLEALRAAAGPAPAADYERVTWNLGRALLAHDEAQGWGLTRNPSRLRILTIDAFCASLVAQMPVLSRFGAAQTVNPAPARLYRRAARRLLGGLEDDSVAGPALSTLLRHLDNDRRRVEGLVEAMLGSRDRWLPLVAGSGRPELAREALQDTLRECCESALQAASAHLTDALAEDILTFLPTAAAQVDDDQPLAACRGMDAVPAPTIANLALWRGVRALLLKADGAPRKTVAARDGFLAPSKTRDAEEKARRQAHKSAALDTLRELEAHPALCHALAALDTLPEPEYDDQQWQALEALMTLLPRAAAELKVLFQDVGEIDFTEQSLRALVALGPADAPTDLALALDYRISHLLIDEFQDTSRSQFELAQRLVAGWQPGDGRTLFLVGDPMQSIYRFRDADVGLFLEAQLGGLGDVALLPLTLQANFRSRPALVDGNNDVFARIFPAQANPQEGAVTFAPADAQRSPGGQGIKVHGLPDADAQAEAAAVLECVQSALADSPGDVAILVRSRPHLRAIIPALIEADIRYQAVDIVPLRDSPAVIDLWSLTRALLHLADRTAWLSILRAPWCGLTLGDLYALVGDAPNRTVWECIVQAQDRALGDDGRARLAQVADVLERALALRGRRDVRRWVEGTWHALGGPRCVSSEHELRNAQTYLDLLEELDGGGDGLRADDLERAVDGLYAQTPADEHTRVRIMTIHKAKGLEFDTVIVPGLQRSARPNDKSLLSWLEFADGKGRLRRLLAPIASASKAEDATVSYVRQVETRRERAEALRLLYVAATRARENLHLFACVARDDDGRARAPRAGSLLSLLWPALGERFADAVEADVLAPPVATEPAPLRLTRLTRAALSPGDTLLPPWRGQDLVLPVDERQRVDWAGDIGRHVGTAVHRVLQQVAEEGVDTWISRWADGLEIYLQRMLATLGVRPESLDDAASRAATAVRRCLEDERGRWILARHAQARSELALSGWLDGRVRNVVLDRTFVDEDGVRWIIDYKTAEPGAGSDDAFMDAQHELYREQLHTYARVVRRIDAAGAEGERPIRLALYFPLLPGWREWAYERA